MKSIKPGRGPSRMNLLETIIGMVFIIFWIGISMEMGAPSFFPIFGVLVLVVLVVQAIYHYKNGFTKDRYSIIDITSDQEEPDPFNQKYQVEEVEEELQGDTFCPYCGAPADHNYKFCRKCGKELPR